MQKLLLSIGLSIASGCASAPSDPPSSAPAPVEPSTQYDLLRDIVAAEQGDDVATYNRVRNAWQGRTLRWETFRLPELCRPGPHPCHTVPFDSGKVDFTIRQGWLPRLELDDAGRARLEALCEGHEPCVLTFEGRLDTFRFARDEYTRLAFADVTLVSARTAGADEYWGRRHPPGRDDLEPVRKRAQALLERGYRPTLRAMPSEGGRR